MPRKSSTLDEAVMLIQILTRIPKGRLITAQQLKQELDAAGIPIRIRTLQRYLKTMASTDVFGIDCDMRSRPYGYKPVSYTHLDVYKRQPQRTPLTSLTS